MTQDLGSFQIPSRSVSFSFDSDLLVSQHKAESILYELGTSPAAAGSHEDEPELPPASRKRLPHLLRALHPGGKSEPVP